MEGSAAELLMEESAVELVHRVQQYVENTPDVADHATDWPRLVEAWSSLRKACSSAERGLRRTSFAEGCATLFSTQVQQERGITCGWVAGCGSLDYFGSRLAGRHANHGTNHVLRPRPSSC